MYKILVVDDSAFMRQLIRSILEQTGGFSVSIAQTPLIALEKLKREKFDAITIDYEMPFMNGVELTKKIKELTNTKIIMISAYTHPSAYITFDALEAGIFDYILKPMNENELPDFKEDLIKKVQAACESKQIPDDAKKMADTSYAIKMGVEDDLLIRAKNSKIVGIGISTGGPPVLEKIFKGLKKDFKLPILVVQHMPPNFTKVFADRLASISGMCIKEAEDKEEIKDGCIYIAKGGFHLAVQSIAGKSIIRVLDGDKVKNHKPSADILFSSIADAYEQRSIGIIMTGMGNDGADGILEMKKKDAVTIAQDEKSCVVFGMPKSAIEKNAIDAVMDVDEIINFLNGI